MKSKTFKVQFFCPKHGVIERNDVEFWCNHCRQDKIILKDEMYLCPACLEDSEGKFTCVKCGQDVKMIELKNKKFIK